MSQFMDKYYSGMAKQFARKNIEQLEELSKIKKEEYKKKYKEDYK